MAFKVRFSDSCLADFDRLVDYLAIAYLNFGDTADQAFNKAAARVSQIKDALIAFKHHPHRGTLVPNLRPGLRHLTIDRAIVYFEIVEPERLVHVMAVFFGGQDHKRHIANRLRTDTTDA